MVRVSKQRRVAVPYGGPNNITVYINEVLYDGIFNFNVQKYLDNVWIFDAVVPGSNRTDSNLLRGNTVKIFIANDIFLKGTIESSKYKTANTVAIKGVGSVAYKLRAKTVTQNEENKSFYNAKTSEYVGDHLCSTNLDGIAPFEVTTNHEDIYPSIFVRMDNENRLAGIMGTAKACNYNWYESWGSFPWNDNVMNLADHKGSESSTFTFEVSGDSQNTINSEREENREKLYNDITCYDKKTEILTKHGFKFFNDVSYDDEIATLNQDTGYLEYHKPTAKQKYMYEGKMYKIKTKYLDLKITPDHELYTIRPNNGGVKHSGWGGKQIQDVVKDKMYFTVKKDSGWEGKQKKYFMLPGIITNPNGRNKRVITQKKIPMDLWVKFFGWYITEGSLDKNIKKGYKISIRQCNLKNKKEIYDIAKDMGYNVFDIKDGSVQFYDKQLYTYLTQFGYSGDKFIPTEIKNLNKELLSELILTMFKGDGCIKDGKLLSYYTKSKRLIDDVQELLLKTGKACKTYKRRNIYELSVNHKYLTIKYPHHRWKNKITTVDTKEYVYDVTVPNHIIYVKRNGIASWQKNCLGYGDGINQLKTKIFHATDNRTYLTVAMTKNGTETITVADTTSFDATGDLWIGCEKVSYTGKTGTTFTGITRSVAFADKTDVVESYVHTKFIEVYDAQYTRTSAETDSSIGDGTELNDANWGINEQTFTDKTIIDQDTLDKIAYYLLLQHKDVVISITLNPMEIYDTMNSVELGDVVTINDTDLGVTGAEYRIIGIELGRDNAVPYITIKCSTSYMNVTDIISRMESESKSLTSYMQGSPSVVSVQSYENAQYSATPEDKAMKMKFRVWDKTIAITDARLDFKVLPFRGYTSTTSSTTTADGTNIVSNTFNASGLAYVTYHKLDWVDLVVIGSPVKIPTAIIDEHVVDYTSGRYILDAGAWEVKAHWTWTANPGTNVIVRDVDSGTFRKTRFIGALTNNFSSTRTFNWSLRLTSKTGTVLANGSKSLTAGESHTFEAFDTPINYIGSTVWLIVTNQTFNATTETDASQIQLTAYTYANQSHEHTTEYGIDEDTDYPTIKVAIGFDKDPTDILSSDAYFNANKSYLNGGVVYSAYNPLTPSSGIHDNINISTELKALVGDLSTTKRIRLQFEPQGSGNTCRIEANVDLFTFLGST